MAQVINTNIPSLNAQRNLNNSQSALSTSLQRLSSGLRINSAKDDAAGLAISERFSTQIRGLNQAIRNANDGTSLAQTGEGALAEVTSNLQRIRELAVQSVNSSNSASDRAALQLEVQQRIDEIDRTASQTSFNGLKILDGTFGASSFQVGANVGETIGVTLSTSMRTATIGKTADIVGAAVYSTALNAGQQGTGVTGTALTGANLTIAVGTGTAVAIGSTSAGGTGQTNTSAWAKAAAINAAGVAGLNASADTTLMTAFTTVADADYKLSINGVTIANGDYSTNTITGAAMAALINSNQSATGVGASFAGGNLTLQAIDGRDIAIQQGNAAFGADATTGLGLVTNAAGRTNNTVNAALTSFLGSHAAQSAKGSVRLMANTTITTTGAAAADIGFGNAVNYQVNNNTLSSASVTTVATANATINTIDSALATVSGLRSTFGAIQNRFESVTTSLAATTENLTAARSRILDADYAQETAALTRNQILQQAGIAMLSQANQLPNTVLSLLK